MYIYFLIDLRYYFKYYKICSFCGNMDNSLYFHQHFPHFIWELIQEKLACQWSWSKTSDQIRNTEAFSKEMATVLLNITHSILYHWTKEEKKLLIFACDTYPKENMKELIEFRYETGLGHACKIEMIIKLKSGHYVGFFAACDSDPYLEKNSQGFVVISKKRIEGIENAEWQEWEDEQIQTNVTELAFNTL
jgi:hypothetical protein